MNNNKEAIPAASARRQKQSGKEEGVIVGKQTPIVEFAMENALTLRKRSDRKAAASTKMTGNAESAKDSKIKKSGVLKKDVSKKGAKNEGNKRKRDSEKALTEKEMSGGSNPAKKKRKKWFH